VLHKKDARKYLIFYYNELNLWYISNFKCIYEVNCLKIMIQKIDCMQKKKQKKKKKKKKKKKMKYAVHNIICTTL
jgi:hypothetical protein